MGSHVTGPLFMKAWLLSIITQLHRPYTQSEDFIMYIELQYQVISYEIIKIKS